MSTIPSIFPFCDKANKFADTTVVIRTSSDLSIWRSETAPFLPFLFDGKVVSRLYCDVIVYEASSKIPLVAYMHNTGRLRLRKKLLKRRTWDYMTKTLRDLSGDSAIDPYDACILIAMAQCAARLCLTDKTEPFHVGYQSGWMEMQELTRE